jgi:hypothetical protein
MLTILIANWEGALALVDAIVLTQIHHYIFWVWSKYELLALIEMNAVVVKLVLSCCWRYQISWISVGKL